MFPFLKKKECRYDPEKFSRFEYNGIEVLIENDPLEKTVRGGHPSESYRIDILDFTKKKEDN